MAATLKSIFISEVQKRLQEFNGIPNVSARDLESLPAPIQKYLLFTGVIGKPQIYNFRVRLKGQMKKTPKGRAMKIKAIQYSFIENPSRFFYIRSHHLAIPMTGLHVYSSARASMEIKIANQIKVVDAHGPEMDQGETVTMFNDLCLLAPAALIDLPIVWEVESPTTVHATFTNLDQSIKATLFFDKQGALYNFISHDRYESADGLAYSMFPWSTPVTEYKEISGRMLPKFAQAIWQMPEGEFPYAQFELIDIQYNCSRFTM